MTIKTLLASFLFSVAFIIFITRGSQSSASAKQLMLQNPIEALEGLESNISATRESQSASKLASWLPVQLTCDANTVALYHFDEVSGQDVFDSCQYGNHGTAIGTNIVDGKLGLARYFNGNGDHVLIPDSPSLNPTSLTIEAWIKPSNVDQRGDIVSKDGENIERQYLLHMSDMYDNFVAHIGRTNGDFWVYDGTTSPIAGEWFYIAQTYDGEDLLLYVNGVYDPPSAFHSAPGGVTVSTQPVRIGGGAPSGEMLWFNGIIDEVRISNTALTEEQIWSNYASTPTDVSVSELSGISRQELGPVQIIVIVALLLYIFASIVWLSRKAMK